MACEIRYNTSSYTFQEAAEDYRRSGLYSFNGFGLELPDDLDKLFQIRVTPSYDYDVSLETESAVTLPDDDAVKLWSMLAPGAEMPGSQAPQTSVLFAEAIWLDTLWAVGALRTFHKYSRGERVIYSLGEGTFEYLASMAHDALDAGALERIDSWLSGVPLEYVLAE